MLILSLDTSSPSGSVAIARDSHLLGVISTTTGEAYSSRIFRQLDYLLSETSLSLDQFDLFAVNAGPGSFTGLRVGLAAAKAWGEAFSKPIAAVNGLEAVAIQAGGAKRVISVLDARRGQLYTASYIAEAASASLQRESREPDQVLTPQQFLIWLKDFGHLDRGIIATTSIGWLRSLFNPSELTSIGVEVCEVSPILAPPMLKIAFARAQSGETVDALRLDANYVRRSDAELNWKEK